MDRTPNLQNLHKVLVSIIVSVLLGGGSLGWYMNYTTSNAIPTPPNNPQPLVGNIFTTTTVTQTTATETTSASDTTAPSTISTTTISATSSNTTQSTTDRLQTPWGKEWINYANIAWQYYAPGFGVDAATGLLYASQYFTRFTDWDLAGYIMAILAAEELGLVNQNGTWGADYRLNLILNFLATRTLVNQTDIPYQFYDATTGLVLVHSNPGDGSDGGRLLIALYDLKLLNPEFTSRINAVVNRVNYSYLANSSFFQNVGLYPMYSAAGFQLWGFNTHSPAANSSGPAAGVLVYPEPVMLSILENVANPFLANAGSDAYSGLYSMYNRTGDLVGFGEGWYPPVGNQSQAYVYEAIEVPDGTNYSAVTAQGENLNTPPETFTKIVFALLAVYNSTYSQIIVNHIGTSFETAHGFLDGFIAGTNQVVTTTSGNTNNMIMEAAVYAIFAARN